MRGAFCRRGSEFYCYYYDYDHNYYDYYYDDYYYDDYYYDYYDYYDYDYDDYDYYDYYDDDSGWRFCVYFYDCGFGWLVGYCFAAAGGFVWWCECYGD